VVVMVEQILVVAVAAELKAAQMPVGVVVLVL
jgi:hypothetical protein